MNARTMNKIEFVYRIARFGFLLALGVLALTALFATAAPVKTDARSNPNFAKTTGQGADSGRLSNFRWCGRHRFLRAVGSFPGRHDSG